MKNIALRADASVRTGTGHLRRCISLAHALVACGARPYFISRQLDGTAATILRDTPFPVTWLPEAVINEPIEGEVPSAQQKLDASQTIAVCGPLAPAWVLVDHYGLSSQWHREVAQALKCRIAVIDDLADRPLACDVLLIDPNWHADHQAKYQARLEAPATLLGGPRYALLDDHYRHGPKYRFKPKVDSIGIFLGGTDPAGLSALAARSCRRAGFDGPVEIATTSANPRLSQLKAELALDRALRLTINQPDLSAFFARHDLHIGAGGGATWERCCMGCANIAMVVANNQRAVVPALAELGVLRWARAQGGTLEQALSDEVRTLLHSPKQRQALCKAGLGLVDGWGIHRVAAWLLASQLTLTTRLAKPDDEALLLSWSNDPTVRAQSFSSDPIAEADHHRWFTNKLTDSGGSRIFIVHTPGGLPLGQVRFDRVDPKSWRINYAMDAGMRGAGLGRALLSVAADTLTREFTGAVELIGEVKSDNTASCRVFEGLEFEVLTGEDAHASTRTYRKAWHPAGKY
ncbi:UDP-2,4-diacetamido-2,4,6-trideoxy-beta-L-altropyranose hydrolase [Acidovorax radicis]|uniref:UDP-2,4-diacetamido-2,4, 6-trideoxy-beta-L-altropyranose hydrolase n=1 Tax=Acidovorax radicis TaxID=758826 RepID=UPI001CFA957F|nr:UDP-2,4-diacetamido-2,4,6-trideoxy-beta-L-altropyranose hydrolase [Acidovorax radicis]UCV00553.1 UDP-2,4-diacetamido-2,4,6-trideoxy-beta-L-altropyranose hydrolase [Acidovorax radicis]